MFYSNKKIKNISISVLLASFAFIMTVSGFRATKADASYFGGMKTMTFMCTCTGNQLIYIQDYACSGVLALVYDGSARLYSNNNIYGTYLLGSYSSGGNCQYLVGEECVEMKSDGSFDSNPGTGTS
ncbi:MAG: hypothetical protein AAB895_02725 [Patescibacteria group bacterium]